MIKLSEQTTSSIPCSSGRSKRNPMKQTNSYSQKKSKNLN